MDSTEAIKCYSCKKDIAGDFSRCTGCKCPFHPGCFKAHRILTSKGDRITCTGSAEPIRRTSSTPTLSASSTLSVPSQPADPSLAHILAAIKEGSDKLNLFIEKQDRHNKEQDEQLSTLRRDVVGKMDRIAADLKSIVARVKSVEDQLGKLATDVQVVTTSQDALATSLTSRLDTLEKSSKTYADVARETAAKTAALTTTVDDLARRMNSVEDKYKNKHHSRETQLVLSNLPERPNENLVDVMHQLSRHLGVTLGTSDILRVARMRGTTDADRPRLIHIEMASCTTRDALLRGKRTKGKVTVSEVESSLGPQPLYLNEFLHRDTLTLLRTVRAEARSRGYRYIWHRSGSIYVKKEAGERPIVIDSAEEIPAKLC